MLLQPVLLLPPLLQLPPPPLPLLLLLVTISAAAVPRPPPPPAPFHAHSAEEVSSDDSACVLLPDEARVHSAS